METYNTLALIVRLLRPSKERIYGKPHSLLVYSIIAVPGVTTSHQVPAYTNTASLINKDECMYYRSGTDGRC